MNMRLGQSTQVEKQEQVREDGIFTDNFGGLNTTASNLNCPYEDSPLLENIDIDISGRVRKRRGTKVIQEFNARDANDPGYTLVPFTSGLQYSFLIEKVGRQLEVNYVNNNTLTSITTKTEVWSQAAENVKATWALSSEIVPKLYFATGTNKIVRVSVVEQQRIETAPSSTNFVFEEALAYENATTSDVAVFKNRVLQPSVTISYNGTTEFLTLNGINTVDGDVVDVVYFSWQYAGEAYRYRGNDFYDKVARFNAVETDQIIEVPRNIRWDALVDDPRNPFRFGMTIYSDSEFGSSFSFAADREPSDATTYAHSSGARYVYDVANNNKVDPTPFFITFGALEAGSPSPITEVHFLRLRPLTFFNNGSIQAQFIEVFVNGESSTRQPSGGSGDYQDHALYTEDAVIVGVSGASRASFIDFQVAPQVGVPGDALIEIVSSQPRGIGSNATNNVIINSQLSDGAIFPVYGLGRYEDNVSGSYARNVQIFNGRMYLSGFLNQPLRVAVSSLYDFDARENYTNFQLREDQTLPTASDPFDFVVNSRADDYTTGLIPWQSSLFVFTRQSVYRVFGGDGGITPTSFSVSRISQSGLVNPQSVVVTDKSILYLSDFGVYDLFNSIEAIDYQAGERSIKIRNIFGITANPQFQSLPWMSYDTTDQKLYLGYPKEGFTLNCYDLFVYNTYRNSWTKYTTMGGWNAFYGTEYTDTSLGKTYGAMCSTKFNGTDFDNMTFIQFEAERYVDFLKTAVDDGSTTSYALANNEIVIEFSAITNVNTYNISSDETQSYISYDMLPLIDITDVAVEWETFDGSGVFETVPPTSYKKINGGTIYFTEYIPDNRDIRITPIMPNYNTEVGRYKAGVPEGTITSYYPLVAWRDGVVVPRSRIGISTNGQNIEFESDDLDNNSVLEWGTPYQTYYFSPLLSLQTFTQMKRSKHIYIYFDNEEAQEKFTVSDVNPNSSQTNEDIVGRIKQEVNASLALLFDNNFDSESQVDLYGFSSLVWDDSLFDISLPSSTFRRYTLFKEYLLGLGYAYQIALWSFDETTFALAAYQISPKNNRDRYINFTQ